MFNLSLLFCTRIWIASLIAMYLTVVVVIAMHLGSVGMRTHKLNGINSEKRKEKTVITFLGRKWRNYKAIQ